MFYNNVTDHLLFCNISAPENVLILFFEKEKKIKFCNRFNTLHSECVVFWPLAHGGITLL